MAYIYGYERYELPCSIHEDGYTVVDYHPRLVEVKPIEYGCACRPEHDVLLDRAEAEFQKY